MKVLSLKQPWAELVLNGRKKIEIRKWNTNFRGEFLIHSSKNPDFSNMKKFGFKDNELVCGSILGKANLIDVKKYANDEEFNQDKDNHLASPEWGDFGFILENPVRFEKPIPAKGQLNFWDFELKSLKEDEKA
jgi:hypothetical protein